MAAPPIYLDECVDYHLVGALRARGFIVSSALDHRMVQIDDEAQLAFATAQGWMLLSSETSAGCIRRRKAGGAARRHHFGNTPVLFCAVGAPRGRRSEA